MLTNWIGKLREKLGYPPGAPVSKRSRRVLIAALVALCLFALYQITAPFLISSNVVRESMERAVAEWTGHDVSIEGTPDIRFWPRPRITLRDITIRKQFGDSERLLAKVARLSASFDLFEAILGRPEFKDFRLAEPEIYVLREPNGRLDWTNDGRLSRAVHDVRAAPNGQSLAMAEEAPIGEVRISNGSFEITDKASGQVTRLEAIDGTLEWPWLSGGLDFKAEAKFNGRKLNFDLASTQPLLLLSGKSGNLSGSITSDLFSGRFSGVANPGANAFLSGDAELSVPDLPAAVAWSGIAFSGSERLKRLAFSARLITNDNALRFENLMLGLNETKATGILDLLMPAEKLPRLSGTLAFDNMDFLALLNAVAPRAADNTGSDGKRRTGIELDVRLSAQKALLGPFSLSEAAVSILNVGDQSRMDILDSNFEGGRMTGRIATVKAGGNGGIVLHLSVQNADFGNIFKGLAVTGPVVLARGSLDLSLDIDRPLTTPAWQNARGTIRFRAGQGMLAGVDLGGIRQLSGSRPYFKLSEADKSGLSFDSLDVSANLANGAADIREGRIVGANDVLLLSGVIPYASNSMALSGRIQPKVQGGSAAPLMVFIGGSWPDPIIWPISQTPSNALQ